MFFFFNNPATTEIYTLPLRDALPICEGAADGVRGRDEPPHRAPDGGLDWLTPPHRISWPSGGRGRPRWPRRSSCRRDRKSTRLNSSHAHISYAGFCL